MYFLRDTILLVTFCGFVSTAAISDSAKPYRPALQLKSDPFENITFPQWGDPKENRDLIEERLTSFPRLLHNVAYKGNARKTYELQLREIDVLMQENYNTMIDNVGRNLFPVIFATDVNPTTGLSGIGTEYTLFLENGTTLHITPTPVEYEMYKSLAHIPMGIYTIISAYFENPTATGWIQKLHDYRVSLYHGMSALNALNGSLSDDVGCETPLSFQDQRKMFDLVKDYLDDVFETKNVSYTEFTKFTTSYQPYIKKGLACVTELQIKYAYPELKKWKEALGDSWRDLYVILPVIWPVARINPRQIMLESLMDADRRKTHIIKVENVVGLQQSFQLLGRVVGDRTLAQLVFGYADAKLTDLNLALSTRRDLVTTDAENAFAKIANGALQKAINASNVH